MVMPHRLSSSCTQSIHRELQRRRPKLLAPKSSATMKPSASPPPPCESARYTSREPRPRPPSEKIPSSFAAQSRCRRHRRPVASSTSFATPTRRLSPDATISVRCLFTQVSARSYSYHRRRASEARDDGRCPHEDHDATMLKTEKALVLWLKAMVVSPTHEGYEPPSCSASPCASAATATVPVAKKKEMLPAPRPTRARKNLRLIRRNLLPEMERQARADLQGY
uniref:Uncharacterized protein n=1 Tax=Setaria viridis TaxID=4556 RepID=A0A4V6DBP2_SETVI|nr:hypothetical protein SEVIR_2G328700v2 [Setaria viridis]